MIDQLKKQAEEKARVKHAQQVKQLKASIQSTVKAPTAKLPKASDAQNGTDDSALADPIHESLNRRGLMSGELQFDRVVDPALNARASTMSSGMSSQSTNDCDKQMPGSVLMPLKFKDESSESKKKAEPLGPRKQEHPYLETIRGPKEQAPKRYC
mmetsp:Transcript_39557/g.60438  ORF Transcript_39557/g.60438 Transcript_39557/m.60438 type:complete len:155 (-) Transcript_39557:3488-3952(-)